FEKEIAEKEIQVETDLDRGLPLALVDERRIGQVLENILNNGIKYNYQKGRVRLNKRRRWPRQCQTNPLPGPISGHP
ncbi:hypothetical protein HKBW3S09_01599, partial [Candidatus Hakubella thermalkaliphila]